MKYLLFLAFSLFLHAQKLSLLNNEKDTISFRGLSVVDESIFWVAGSAGMIGKTVDGGKTFQWYYQKKYAQNEFRDIHAFDTTTAYVMAISEPAAILETNNGGNSFKKKFIDKSAFIDALDCLNPIECLCVGDAQKASQLFLLSKQNEKWKNIEPAFSTPSSQNFFAASGSNIQMISPDAFIAISGGEKSLIMYRYKGQEKIQEVPILMGSETTGANGFYYNAEQNLGIVVGGDFTKKEASMFNMVRFFWNSEEQQFDFELPFEAPSGYKSGVCQLDENLWVCCGTSGIDYTKDGGIHWIHLSDESYHVVQKRNSRSAILAGSKGKIAVLEFED